MSNRGTAVEQKQQFLQLRKQFLSRGIVPSEKLKRIAIEGGIELPVLKGALDKVNRELKQHSRKVYSRQMTEHVTEQIDKYYWASGARSTDPFSTVDAAADADADAIYQTDDLSQDEHISKLPLRWDTSADTQPHDHDEQEQEEAVDQDTYLAALTQLQSLSARRLTLQQKLNTYRTLLALLEPYRNPKERVQKNLVWRDAPLAGELGRTRTLAIRVAGRVEERFGEGVGQDDGQGDVVMVEDEAKAKVERVLDSW